MPMIRTVFQPDTLREVDEAEAAQLKREGLLLPLEEPGVDETSFPAPSPKAVALAAAMTPPQPTTMPAKEASPDGGKAQ